MDEGFDGCLMRMSKNRRPLNKYRSNDGNESPDYEY